MKNDQWLGHAVWPLRAVTALCLALSGWGVLYVMNGQDAKHGLDAHAQDAACPDSAAAIHRVEPLIKGEVAAMILSRAPSPMPDISFEVPGGAVKKLGDFRGRTILLNLWATWCIPCREEMPALDQLQRKIGSDEFEVVAVSIDTARLEKRQSFLASAGVSSLAFYADPKASIFQVLKAVNKIEGLPTSWLIGKDGCEIGSLQAKADWAAPEALALIQAALR